MATTFAASGAPRPTRSLLADNGDNYNFSTLDGFSQNYVADMVIVDLPIKPTQLIASASGVKTMVSGARVCREVNTTGIGGISLIATKNQIAWSFVVPWDFDPKKEFAIRFEYATARAMSKATDLLTTVSKWSKWDLSDDTGAIAATVFSETTNETTLNAAVANGRVWSTWDSVNDSAVLNAALIPAEDRILGVTDFTVATNTSDTKVIGMQLGYYKRLQM